ncbi:MAG TPA: hypothetical protein VGD67_18410 [Pseudonocardiaceae bacterium]
MSRTALLIGGVVLVAILLAVLVATDLLPGWAAVLLTGAAAVLAAVLPRARRAPVLEPEVHYVPPAPVAAPVPAPRRPMTATVQEVRLPSADPDYRFLLYGTVCWHTADGFDPVRHGNAEELARRNIIHRAAQVTRTEQPGMYDLVQHKLNHALAQSVPDHTGCLDAVWAQGVGLTLPREDLERQYQLATVRKEEQVWEHRRKYERNVRAYLADEVLGTTGSALVWWLARDDSKVPEAVEMIGTLARLTAAANNREVDPIFRALVYGAPAAAEAPQAVPMGVGDPPAPGLDRVSEAARIVHVLADTLFGGNGAPRRALFADELAGLVAAHGDDELAARIRADFDLDLPGDESPAAAPGSVPAPAEVPAPDGAANGDHGGRHVMPGSDDGFPPVGEEAPAGRDRAGFDAFWQPPRA